MAVSAGNQSKDELKLIKTIEKLNIQVKLAKIA